MPVNSISNLDENSLTDFCIIIPSLNPDRRLSILTLDLIAHGFGEIIVINDGSSLEYDSTFNAISNGGATVIKHSENRGKGCALKTGLTMHY